MIKTLRRLLVFTGKVLAVALLYNIAGFLVLRGLPPPLFSRLYELLVFFEALFFMTLGALLIISSLFSTIERYKYQYVGLGSWVYKGIEQSRQRERRYVLLRGVTLILIGLLFLFLSISIPI